MTDTRDDRHTIDTVVAFAAGKGTRLGDLVAERPKPMLEIGGRPLLARILDGWVAAGVARAVVIVGYLAEVVEAELPAAVDIDVTFVHQTVADGTARALQLARPHLADDETFAFGWGDVLVDPGTYAAVLDAGRATGAALAVNHVEDPSAGAAVYLDADGLVTDLVEKPAPGTSTTNWNNAGIGVLPPGIWPYVDALEPSERGEWELPRAVAQLIGDGTPVRGVPVTGEWVDIGTPDALAEARAAFAAD